MSNYTEKEIFETLMARLVREELDREIIDFVVNGTPMTSTPMLFESKELEEQWKKNFDEVVNRDIPLPRF